MDTNLIIPFDYGDYLIRVIKDENGAPWWVAKDVCNVLELTNSRMAIQNLDDDEKGVSKVYTLGGEQNITTINEPGLYTLIIRSNKPEAKTFKRWITHDVLPSIRKTGGYQRPGGDSEGFIHDAGVKKAGNMYFPMAKLVESADKYLEGKAALKALNYFTGMPVDDLIAEIEQKKLKTLVGTLDWGKKAIEDFLAEECEFGDTYQIQSNEAYKAFCDWCRNQGIMRMLSHKKFGMIVSAGFERAKSGYVYYVGFRLKQDESCE